MTLKSMLSTHILVGIQQLTLRCSHQLPTAVCYITYLTVNLCEYQTETTGYILSF